MENDAHGEGASGLATELVLETARKVVTELLLRMKVKADVAVQWIEPEDGRESRHVLVDVTGEDLGIILSRRAEPLAALQQLSRMIISRQLGEMVPVVVDVNGYRRKREQQLRRMARRAAEQAFSRGRTVVLEPMPANERRVVHLELRDHQDVTTESVGVGRQRKVTVVPKPKAESQPG
jgi:spoIIIJ-associated protein